MPYCKTQSVRAVLSRVLVDFFKKEPPQGQVASVPLKPKTKSSVTLQDIIDILSIVSVAVDIIDVDDVTDIFDYIEELSETRVNCLIKSINEIVYAEEE